MNLAGAADLQVVLEGSMNDPHIRGQVNGRNLQVENTQWRSLQLGLQASKSGVSIQNGSLVNTRQGYVNFELSFELALPAFEPDQYTGDFSWSCHQSAAAGRETRLSGLRQSVGRCLSARISTEPYGKRIGAANPGQGLWSTLAGILGSVPRKWQRSKFFALT